MSISPFRFYSIYSSTRLHFTTSYDIFKYDAKSSSIRKDVFDDRKERELFTYFSHHMQTQKEALKFCVFNFLSSRDWLYNTYDEARDKYVEKMKFYDRFSDNIEKDNETINQLRRDKNKTLDEIIQPTRSGGQPPLLQLYYQNRVSLEFCCILDNSYHFTDTWKKSIDPLMQEISMTIRKYRQFVVLFNKA